MYNFICLSALNAEQVLAAAVNPSDVKNATGTFHDEVTLPRTPGRDFAGVVRELQLERILRRCDAHAEQVIDGPSHLLNKQVFGSGGRRGA